MKFWLLVTFLTCLASTVHADILSSNSGAFLPLSGGTVTGQLTISSATVTNRTILSGPVTVSSAAFIGISLSTETAGSAGTAVTALCPAGTVATGGGCSCSGGVAVTGSVGKFNCATAGCQPSGYTCQEPGGTGGACSAQVSCSRIQ